MMRANGSVLTTIDSICRGELILEQPTRGYRFNVDSLILADFALQAMKASGIPLTTVVDLGAGCGVVGLLVAKRLPGCRVILVEIQQELAEMARGNAVRNGVDKRVEIRCADLREPEAWLARPPGVIVSNAPYFKVGAGRISADPQVALAKHEIACNLDQLLVACASGLSVGGMVCLIHAWDRLNEIREGLCKHRFGALVIRGIQPLPRRPCARVLVSAIKGEQESETTLPTLVVENAPGTYSPIMQRILGEA